MQIYLPIGYRLNFPISAFLQIHNISADSYIICRYHPYLQIYPCRMPQHHESVRVHLQITYADNFVYLQITYLICRYFQYLQIFFVYLQIICNADISAYRIGRISVSADMPKKPYRSYSNLIFLTVVSTSLFGDRLIELIVPFCLS